MADAKKDEKSKDLPALWQQLQSAIWLLGLAILAWQGWWWPGILILVAISGLTQAGIQLYVNRGQEQAAIETTRAKLLPATCPSCGAPISASTVHWTGPNTASCPYCNANIKVTELA